MTTYIGFALLAAMLGIFMPVRYLLAGTVVATVLVPVAYLDLPPAATAASPGALLLTAWVLRSHASRAKPSSVILSVVVVLWVLISSMLSTAPEQTWSWAVAFIAVVLLPNLKSSSEGAVMALSVWLFASVVLSVYAVLETWVLHFNPMQVVFDASVQNELTQRWSVYRATTLLGHPLVNSMFFCVGFAIALGRVARRRNAQLNSLCAVIVLAGVLATSSRSGLLAALMIVLFVVLSPLLMRGRSRRGFWPALFLMATIGPALWWVSSQLLESRSDSWEASDSTLGRSRMFDAAMSAIGDGTIFGAGPNALSQFVQKYLGVSGGNFENSWLELAIGVGVTGAALILSMVIFSVLGAVSRGNIPAAAALLGYAVAAGSFNLFFGYPSHLALFGVLLISARDAGREYYDRFMSAASRQNANYRAIKDTRNSNGRFAEARPEI